METIRGRKSLPLDFNGLKDRLANYDHIVLDLGTGDGRYVRALAEQQRDWFVIGVDACRENLREHSQVNLQNMLFVIASAQELPREFNGLISHITVNFPWGSLLESLLNGDPTLMCGLESISRFKTSVDIRLNGGALAEAGTSLDRGINMIQGNLDRHGWKLANPCFIDPRALGAFPSTWAKRLAHGRDPRAIALSGRFIS